MRPPFPGMDPWLERPDLWSDVHHSLFAAISDALMPRVAPRYVVRVEVDALMLPSGDEIQVPFLAVRAVPSRVLVTLINVYDSPEDRRTRDALVYYWSRHADRDKTDPNLVEIDLVRPSEPMELKKPPKSTDYRILIYRSRLRPAADTVEFSIRTPIPTIPIPLLPGDAEPNLELNEILHALYERAGYDLSIDYQQPPQPRLHKEDQLWAAAILARAADSSPENSPGNGR